MQSGVRCCGGANTRRVFPCAAGPVSFGAALCGKVCGHRLCGAAAGRGVLRFASGGERGQIFVVGKRRGKRRGPVK